jgi:signal transduction histidine kinase
MKPTKSYDKNDSLDLLDFPDAYVRLAPNGVILFLNPTAKNLLLGDNTTIQDFKELLYEEETADFFGKLTLVKELGSIGNFTFRTRYNPQKMVFTPNAYHDVEGNLLGVHGIVRPQELLIQYLSGIPGDLLPIIEKSPFGLAIHRENGEVYSNPAFLKIMEQTEIQIALKTIPQWRKRVSIETKKKSVLFSYVLESSTKQREISVKAIRVPDTEGTMLFVIDSQPPSINQVFSTSSHFPTMNGAFDYMSIGVLCENANGQIILANQKMAEVLFSNKTVSLRGELTLSEFIGRYCKTPSDFEKLMELCNRLRRSNKRWVKDLLDFRKGKKLEIMTWMLHDDEGQQYMGRFWTFSDLEKSPSINDIKPVVRNRYGRIIEDMNIGLVEVNQKYKIQMTNKTFLEMTGLTDKNIAQNTIVQALGWDEIVLKKILNKNKAPVELFYNEKNFLIFGAPRMSMQGKVNGHILVFYDNTVNKNLINERKKLVTKLEERNLALQEYAHMVSHDLKAPLRSIHTLCSWLKDDYSRALGGEGAKTLDLLQNKVARMEGLIKDILGYSTLKRDRLDNLVDPNQIIADVLTLIEVPNTDTIRIPEPLPKINAHKTRLHQVFQNLLTNARDHLESDDGKITITARELNDEFEFSVADNGVGIPEEYQESIFSIYQSYNKAGMTSGLGLSIVKKIIDLHKGRVWIDSTHKVGTKIVFTIPKKIEGDLT